MSAQPPVAFVLPAEVLMQLARYLTARPYGEVVELVNALSSLTPIPSTAEVPDVPAP